jgi:hypothetical protein
MDQTDDFELLGRAVSRVLRDAFATAAEARERTVQFQAGQANAFDVELARVLEEMRALPAKVAAEREAEAKTFAASLDEAKREVDDALTAAREVAEAIRAQAVADARAIVDGAAAEVAKARELVAEERVRLDAELKGLVREVRNAIVKLETSTKGDHAEMLDRASTEARMILRQARLHHRSTAKEVDRMIEAAAAEAASLRNTALSDAARVAARVRGVVDVPAEAPAEIDELPLRSWRRPAAEPPGPEATSAAPATPAGDATVVEHRPRPKRRGRLAS